MSTKSDSDTACDKVSDENTAALKINNLLWSCNFRFTSDDFGDFIKYNKHTKTFDENRLKACMKRHYIAINGDDDYDDNDDYIYHLSPLSWASYNGYLELVKFLLPTYILPLDAPMYIYTSWATAGGHIDILQYFAKMNVSLSLHNNAILSEAVNCNHIELVKWIYHNTKPTRSSIETAIKTALKKDRKEIHDLLMSYQPLTKACR